MKDTTAGTGTVDYHTLSMIDHLVKTLYSITEKSETRENKLNEDGHVSVNSKIRLDKLSVYSLSMDKLLTCGVKSDILNQRAAKRVLFKREKL